MQSSANGVAQGDELLARNTACAHWRKPVAHSGQPRAGARLGGEAVDGPPGDGVERVVKLDCQRFVLDRAGVAGFTVIFLTHS